MSHPFDVAELAATYASKSPQDILKLAFEHFGDELWISFSGAEDVVLVDMAWKLNKNVKVFSLDTGRLHAKLRQCLTQRPRWNGEGCLGLCQHRGWYQRQAGQTGEGQAKQRQTHGARHGRVGEERKRGHSMILPLGWQKVAAIAVCVIDG